MTIDLLRHVAEKRQATVCGNRSSERLQHHRREVLSLVDDYMLVEPLASVTRELRYDGLREVVPVIGLAGSDTKLSVVLIRGEEHRTARLRHARAFPPAVLRVQVVVNARDPVLREPAKLLRDEADRTV